MRCQCPCFEKFPPNNDILNAASKFCLPQEEVKWCKYAMESLPCLSLIPMTMVRVVPRGTIPVTGLAQGPLPCCISIQQSTLSPAIIGFVALSGTDNTVRFYEFHHQHLIIDHLVWLLNFLSIKRENN